jgi:hypothetical protein
MGAWGYGSFENDTAMDFVGSWINSKALKNLASKKKIDHYDYDEFRVAAEILVHLHKLDKTLWVDQSIIDGLISGLEMAVKDVSWHDTWRDSDGIKKIIRQMRGFIKKLKKIEGY